MTFMFMLFMSLMLLNHTAVLMTNRVMMMFFSSFSRMYLRQADSRTGLDMVRGLGTALRSHVLHQMRVHTGTMLQHFLLL